MTDDVVLNKKESVERCVRQIRNYWSLPSEVPFERDHLRQDAIALNLQRAAEQCIDLANHAVRVRRLGIPKDSREGFLLLAREGLIPSRLASLMAGMVGFRNVLVHQYQELDLAVLTEVVEHRLEDLLEFTDWILRLEDRKEKEEETP
ncbi:type VII toxin-antitoxin system HepT family RNase toxin [Aminomonas paucivorans]|uniref:type VII toxin-antitoxin system HepT family RNase toxin n=1 Tax=Aminomonas paucivorans TaxID=81412 RepID=UPI00332FDB50